MPPTRKISVVKTAQMSNTLKLILEGSVAGSVVAVGDIQELRDSRDRVLGAYENTEKAIAAFERWLGAEDIGLGI